MRSLDKGYRVLVLCQPSLSQNEANYSLSAIDKENLIRVLATLCPTYIQDYLFTNVCPCV